MNGIQIDSILHDFNLPLDLYRLPKEARAIKPRLLDSSCPLPEDVTNLAVWGNRFDTSSLLRLPKLRFVQLGCSGLDRIDLSRLPSHVKIARSSIIIAPSVASTAISLIYCLSRQILPSAQKRSRSCLNGKLHLMKNVFGANILILGQGRIARLIQKALKNICTVVLSSSKDFKNLESISSYDYIVNVLPLNEHTNQIVDSSFFKMMHSSAYFINVGRGNTVNEFALAEAIYQGQIAGAGLDVHSPRVSSLGDPFTKCRNLIRLPHTGAHNSNYWALEIKLLQRNLERLSLGKRLIDQVA